MKFSLIIPARNGIEYLPACVETIVSQGYEDYELILSEDSSDDGTAEYVDRAANGNVRALHAPRRMSMAEHWEWALSHARGEWLMFVGQDDGLQPYFFRFAEKLVAVAAARGCGIIASDRAYWFWPGCEGDYGDAALSYAAEGRVEILPTRLMGWTALLGIRNYFDLPQMYTTSLFHRSVLERARGLQGGRVFVTHPQDANLAAIAYSLGKRYVHSGIPLGWVGTSPKSAGLAVTSEGSSGSSSLRSGYLESISSSAISCSNSAGAFSIGSPALYFLGALDLTKDLRGGRLDWPLRSRLMRRLVYAGAMREIEGSRSRREARLEGLRDAAAANGIDPSSLPRIARTWLPLARGAAKGALAVFSRISRRRIDPEEVGWRTGGRIEISRSREGGEMPGLGDAQAIVGKAVADRLDA